MVYKNKVDMMIKKIGCVRVLDPIGDGGTSKVYLGYDEELKIDCAIKEIPLGNEIDANIIEREIRIMKSFNHPNIVKLYRVYKTKRCYYMIMELCEGGELFDLVDSNGALDENIARFYFQNLIDALDYIHSKNTAHRDLKPENILVSADGHIKIIDFGLANTFTSSNRFLKTRCGTPNYVAYEVLYEEEYSGEKADIWGAALVLYVMLSAKLPFEDTTLDLVVKKISTLDLTFGENMPPAAVDLIKRIIVREPDARPTIREIREDPWFSINYHKVEGLTIPENDFSIIELNSDISLNSNICPNGECKLNVFQFVSHITNIDFYQILSHNEVANPVFTFSTPIEHSTLLKKIETFLAETGATIRNEGSSLKVYFQLGISAVSFRFYAIPVFRDLTIVKMVRLDNETKGFQIITKRIFDQYSK